MSPEYKKVIVPPKDKKIVEALIKRGWVFVESSNGAHKKDPQKRWQELVEIAKPLLEAFLDPESVDVARQIDENVVKLARRIQTHYSSKKAQKIDIEAVKTQLAVIFQRTLTDKIPQGIKVILPEEGQPSFQRDANATQIMLVPAQSVYLLRELLAPEGTPKDQLLANGGSDPRVTTYLTLGKDEVLKSLLFERSNHVARIAGD